MTFQDNFSRVLLLSESPVFFYLDDPYLVETTTITMRFLTIQETLTDPYIQTTLSVLNMISDDIKEKLKMPNCSSVWELLKTLKTYGGTDQVSRHFNYFCEKIFGDQFVSTDSGWKLGIFELDEQLFERISEIQLIASGLKKYEDQNNGKIKKPRTMIEQEERIRRIKSRAKNGNPLDDGYDNLMKMFLPINYELGYTFEQLFQMNQYHVLALQQQISKIVRYDIQKRQIMSKKKITYITGD